MTMLFVYHIKSEQVLGWTRCNSELSIGNDYIKGVDLVIKGIDFKHIGYKYAKDIEIARQYHNYKGFPQGVPIYLGDLMLENDTPRDLAKEIDEIKAELKKI